MKRLFVILAMLVVACDKESGDVGPAPVGPLPLKSVVIGSQTWSARNLDVDRFANGEVIPEAQTREKWSAASDKKQPAWCYYNQDPANDSIYGKLYNWYAVADPRGLCPKGWHVPSDEEWKQLEDFLGGSEVAGKKLKSARLWEDNINGKGTDTYGWSGLPGGLRTDYGPFDVITRTGGWWSSTNLVGSNPEKVWNRFLYFNLDKVGIYYQSEGVGFSVRCVKD